MFFQKMFFQKMFYQKVFFSNKDFLFKCDMITKENYHRIKMSHQTKIIGSILFKILSLSFSVLLYPV